MVLAGKKRKRTSEQKLRKPSASAGANVEADISRLEQEILQSRKHYNNLIELLTIAFPAHGAKEVSLPAVVTLCRVYGRLFADGQLDRSKARTPAEEQVIQWVEERYQEFTLSLLKLLRDRNEGHQSAAIPLAMQLVKQEVLALGDSVWKVGLFPQLLKDLLTFNESTEVARDQFKTKFFTVYDDVRYHAAIALP